MHAQTEVPVSEEIPAKKRPHNRCENLGCNLLESPDPLIAVLERIIRLAVRALAVLMALVIVWGVLDVVWVLYQRLRTPPEMLLGIEDILATFGAFMTVLIAIEVFANIVVYLESEMIHLRLVLATALMAIARKIIVLDVSSVESLQLVGLGAVVLALGVAYWLIHTGKLREEHGLVSNIDGTHGSTSEPPPPVHPEE